MPRIMTTCTSADENGYLLPSGDHQRVSSQESCYLQTCKDVHLGDCSLSWIRNTLLQHGPPYSWITKVPDLCHTSRVPWFMNLVDHRIVVYRGSYLIIASSCFLMHWWSGFLMLQYSCLTSLFRSSSDFINRTHHPVGE